MATSLFDFFAVTYLICYALLIILRKIKQNMGVKNPATVRSGICLGETADTFESPTAPLLGEETFEDRYTSFSRSDTQDLYHFDSNTQERYSQLTRGSHSVILGGLLHRTNVAAWLASVAIVLSVLSFFAVLLVVTPEPGEVTMKAYTTKENDGDKTQPVVRPVICDKHSQYVKGFEFVQVDVGYMDGESGEIRLESLAEFMERYDFIICSSTYVDSKPVHRRRTGHNKKTPQNSVLHKTESMPYPTGVFVKP
jgi:hypothetical protein